MVKSHAKAILLSQHTVMKWAFLIPPNLVNEALIGSDKSTTILNRQARERQSQAG
jgi:hypothetical protein